jgi:hypothetical protein
MSDYLATIEVRFDATLAAARTDIGDNCDPENPAHAERLRKWLNAWLCRIGYPHSGNPDEFAVSLSEWWQVNASLLPSPDQTLVNLTHDQLKAVANAYGDLRNRVAYQTSRGVNRTIGATASSKILYFVRPLSITAWDDRISGHVGCDRTAEGFLAHLQTCQQWSHDVLQVAMIEGISEAHIGLEIGRPLSSMAKLLDEYLYLTITREMEF